MKGTINLGGKNIPHTYKGPKPNPQMIKKISQNYNSWKSQIEKKAGDKVYPISVHCENGMVYLYFGLEGLSSRNAMEAVIKNGKILKTNWIERSEMKENTDMTLEEHIEKLEELIRLASAHIQHDDDIGALLKKDLRDRMKGQNPECFVSLKRLGREPFFLPICNRKAIVDPKAIAISIGVVKRLMSNTTDSDSNELTTMLDKLTRLKNRYSKEIPTPSKAAGRKAIVTKLMNKMGRYIKTIQPKTDEYKD
jgi:hypothetical protein